MRKNKLFKVLFALAIFGLVQQSQAQNQMLLPDTVRGTNITMNLQTGTYQFYQGVTTNTMGVNGNILGPTLILDKGQQVNFTINNQLSDTTTIHWHGMHVSKGIAGFIIVRDTIEAALNLPRTYGVDDVPVVIQTKTFTTAKQIVVPSNADSVIMANATVNAYYDFPAQMVRLRLLNGSSQRVFNIGFTNNKSFYQIASDGGLLGAPLSLTRLQLAPGERAEIVVDLSNMQGQSINMISYASEFPNGIYGATKPGTMAFMQMTDYSPNVLNGADFNILKLNVIAATSNPIINLPNSLVTINRIAESSANITRTITMSPAVMGPNQLNGHFLLNGVSFDMNVINYTIPFNNVEIWTLKNNSAIAHPFHIHDVQFYILDRNGVAPSASEMGRKDVVLVKGQETVRFIASFNDFADDAVPYMYHCHMLTHEDQGMMGQFVVTTATGIDSPKNEIHVEIYPNPSNGTLYINTDNLNIQNIEVYEITGKLLFNKQVNTNSNSIKLDNLPKGVLFIRIITNKGIQTEKVIVQ